jgi:hypothetical protein
MVSERLHVIVAQPKQLLAKLGEYEQLPASAAGT